MFCIKDSKIYELISDEFFSYKEDNYYFKKEKN